jgi:hypothetical protein
MKFRMNTKKACNPVTRTVNIEPVASLEKAHLFGCMTASFCLAMMLSKLLLAMKGICLAPEGMSRGDRFDKIVDTALHMSIKPSSRARVERESILMPGRGGHIASGPHPQGLMMRSGHEGGSRLE